MIDYRKGDVYCFGLIMLFIVFGFKLLVELFLLSIQDEIEFFMLFIFKEYIGDFNDIIVKLIIECMIDMFEK